MTDAPIPLEALAERFEADPADPERTLAYGRALVKRFKAKPAMEVFRRHLDLVPDDLDAIEDLAKLYSKAQRLDDAIALYEDACRREPASWRATNELATLMLAKRDNAKALALWSDHLVRDPDCWEALNNIALEIYRTGAVDEAFKLYRGWLERHPGHRWASSNLSVLAREQGRFHEFNDVWQGLVEVERQLFPPADNTTGTDAPMDIDAKDLVPAAAAATLAHHGLLVVRSALRQDALKAVQDRLMGASPIRVYGAGRLDKMIATDSILSLLPEEIMGILRETFRRDPLFSEVDSYARRVTVPPGQSFVPFHQDATAFNRVGVNVWVPLDPCGRDRPGLQLVARRVDRAFETTNAYNYNEIPEELVLSRFADSLLAPALEPGDVILFLSSTIHRTYFMPDMRNHRLSLEIRFQ